MSEPHNRITDLSELLGPAGPEVSCEECFELLDSYVDVELSGGDPDARLPGMRNHLAGCPACQDCALITCQPNDVVRPVHDRMPVVLSRDAEGAWIDPAAKVDDLLELLRPAPDEALIPREVGDAVNDVREDGPHLLEPPMKLF